MNDSFDKMLDYKAKHKNFPSTYDDMIVFLSEVHIGLFHTFGYATKRAGHIF